MVVWGVQWCVQRYVSVSLCFQRRERKKHTSGDVRRQEIARQEPSSYFCCLVEARSDTDVKTLRWRPSTLWKVTGALDLRFGVFSLATPLL